MDQELWGRLHNVRNQAENYSESAGLLAEALASLHGTATEHDGDVLASVGPNGELRELVLEDATRDWTPAETAAAVRRCVQRAQVGLACAAQRIVDDLPEGADLASLIAHRLQAAYPPSIVDEEQAAHEARNGPDEAYELKPITSW